MAKVTTYEINRLEGSIPSVPLVSAEREGVFQLTDANWRVVFRDSKSGLSCGLLRCHLQVEPLGRRACRVAIADGSSRSFNGSIVLKASADKVQVDLARRLESLERSGELVAAVDSGQWWRDPEVFDSLDWSHRCSIAGVHYRSGWWGTGRFKPSMLSKVLDFGPSGIVFRGWRTRFLIPWDAIASIGTVAGDAWLVAGLEDERRSPLGTTVVVRSQAGQDAVFFTPLMSPSEIRTVLEPLTSSLAGVDVDHQLRRTGLWQGSHRTAKVSGDQRGRPEAKVDNRAFPELP